MIDGAVQGVFACCALPLLGLETSSTGCAMAVILLLDEIHRYDRLGSGRGEGMACFMSAPRLVCTTPEQDPAKADKITKIQRDLDETTEVLVRHNMMPLSATTRLKLLPFISDSRAGAL